jgi:hypothetical protein
LHLITNFVTDPTQVFTNLTTSITSEKARERERERSKVFVHLSNKRVNVILNAWISDLFHLMDSLFSSGQRYKSCQWSCTTVNETNNLSWPLSNVGNFVSVPFCDLHCCPLSPHFVCYFSFLISVDFFLKHQTQYMFCCSIPNKNLIETFWITYFVVYWIQRLPILGNSLSEILSTNMW